MVFPDVSTNSEKAKGVKLLASWHKSRQCNQTVVVLHCLAFAVYTPCEGEQFHFISL